MLTDNGRVFNSIHNPVNLIGGRDLKKLDHTCFRWKSLSLGIICAIKPGISEKKIDTLSAISRRAQRVNSKVNLIFYKL